MTYDGELDVYKRQIISLTDMGGEVMRAGKWICGSIVGFWGFLAPVQVLILCVCLAIIVDFITGNIARCV